MARSKRPQSNARKLKRAMVHREQILTTEVKGLLDYKKDKKEVVITPAGRIARKARKPRFVTEFVETMGKLFLMEQSSTGHNSKNTKFKKKHQQPFYRVVGQL